MLCKCSESKNGLCGPSAITKKLKQFNTTIWWIFTSLRSLTFTKKYGTPYLFQDQKLGISVQYWKIRIFSKWPLWSIFTLHGFLTSCKKWKTSEMQLFVKIKKQWFWAHFGHICPNFGSSRIFLKNRALSLFYIYQC